MSNVSHHSFFVRIWQEFDAVTALPQWRGSVKQLSDDQIHYFAHLDELLSYIAWVSSDDNRRSEPPSP
ncbi:MAG: hypothetical protein R2867_09910 [Caldilineaceae bacterium]